MPVLIASCVEGELSESVASALAASSLTAVIPSASRLTRGEIAPALTMSTGEPRLRAPSVCRVLAARLCAPALGLLSSETACFAITAWFSGLPSASRCSASDACWCARGVMPSSIKVPSAR